MAKRNITVIWVTPTFRGSAPGDQDQPWDPTSEVNTQPMNTNPGAFSTYIRRLVGEQFYNFTYLNTKANPPQTEQINEIDPQIEIKGGILPNAVIPDASRNFEQEVTAVEWGPWTTGNAVPAGEEFTEAKLAGHGFNDWGLDTILDRNGNPACSVHGSNADLMQEINSTSLFYVDAPNSTFPELENESYSSVYKFRTWLEINIGGKWYVCSPYMPWSNIVHQVTGPGTGYLHPDPARSNEVMQGWLLPAMQGFGTSFTEKTPN